MTSSEEFKQAIREGNISEAFLVAMSNAPQLNITTKIITADGHQVDAPTSQLDNYLHTHINLIEGKVENEIGEQLTGDRYSEIKQFHLEQVTQGHQTIQENLISLQKMFQLMSAFEQQHLSHSSWVDIAADVTRETLTAKPDATQLYAGKVANALKAGITSDTADTAITPENSALETENPEPQLPSFEDENDGVMDDLLSIADIDDDIEEMNDPEESEIKNQGDWSEWLDDEPEEVKPEVFDLKSLNIRQASEKWQNWSPHHDQANVQPPQEES